MDRSTASLDVLVVEDDLLFNQLYGMFFQTKNARVHAAVSVTEALTLLNTIELLDIIILDQLLTDGEGLSLLPTIRRNYPQAVVVMVSGNQDPDFFLRAYNQSVDNYAVKPVNLDLLWVEISRSLNRRQLEKINSKQQAELEQWVEQEIHEQKLAQHIFKSMTSDLVNATDFMKVKIRPSSMFSGDVIFHQQGLDGSWYFLVADSMGHGLAAAVSLMPMLNVFQCMTYKALPLSTIVFELNNKLNKQLPDDRFVACILICINPLLDKIEVWNGGMPPVLMFYHNDDRSYCSARSRHMAMGILDDDGIEVSSEVYTLSDFSRIVMCSDGILETPMPDGHCLTEEDVAAFWQSNLNTGFDLLLTTLGKTQPVDDLSICDIDLVTLTERYGQQTDYVQRDGMLECDYKIYGDCLKIADVTGNIVQILKSLSVPHELCNKTYAVVTELFLNALEHGVLKLDSTVKEREDGFVRYYELKEHGLQFLTEQNFICIRFQWRAADNKLSLRITDSGSGFKLEQDESGLSEMPHGRGLSLIKQLSESVRISGSGNEFEVVLRG